MADSSNDTDKALQSNASAGETDLEASDGTLQSILEEIASMNPVNGQVTDIQSKQTSTTDFIEVIASFSHRLFQAHSAFVESRIDGHGITLRQFVLLSAISSLGSPSQRDLTDGIGMDRSTLSEVIRRLSSNGLILQKQSTEDRRAHVISLTELGRKTLMRTAPIISQAHREFFGILSKAEIDALAGILAKLLKQDAPQRASIPTSSQDGFNSKNIESAPHADHIRNPEPAPADESDSLKRLQRARVAFDAELITKTEFEFEKRRFLEGSRD